MNAGVALLLVDIQNDFMPWGSLPIVYADEVVRVANVLAPRYETAIATQDWHPSDHLSFASNHPGRQVGEVVEVDGIEQVLWPDHCVQNSPGASFHSALDVSRIDAVVRKGVDPRIDSYSAFFDNAHRRDTGLSELLWRRGVEEVVLVGLATDYCVLWSAQDARSLGIATTVVTDGVRAVEAAVGDGDRAFEEMRRIGCTLVESKELSAVRTGR